MKLKQDGDKASPNDGQVDAPPVSHDEERHPDWLDLLFRDPTPDGEWRRGRDVITWNF